jgi:hypothetical protein
MAQPAFAAVMKDLPADIVELGGEVMFPYFCVHAWKNEWSRKHGLVSDRPQPSK